MSRTLLQMVQEAASLLVLTSPNTVTGSSDPQILQLWKICNEEGRKHSARYPWQALTNEATFTTLAIEIQGTLTSIAGAGFRSIVNNTIWNRTLMRPVFGPLTSGEWQQLKAQTMTGPWNQYRIRGSNVIFNPVPTAGQTCAFEWISKYWAVSGTGTAQSSLLADDDQIYLDDEIFFQGLIWRWNKRKGFDYAEDFNDYEKMIADQMAKDGGKQTLNLGGVSNNYPPGIMVPTGSWNL